MYFHGGVLFPLDVYSLIFSGETTSPPFVLPSQRRLTLRKNFLLWIKLIPLQSDSVKKDYVGQKAIGMSEKLVAFAETAVKDFKARHTISSIQPVDMSCQ